MLIGVPSDEATALLVRAREANPLLEVIVITAFGTIADAVEAMKHGAAGYLTKPIDLDDIQVQVQKAVERRNLVSEVRDLRRQVAAAHCRRLHGLFRFDRPACASGCGSALASPAFSGPRSRADDLCSPPSPQRL